MKLSHRQVEELYDKCKNIGGNYPTCEMECLNDEITLKGEVSGIDGYIEVTFKQSDILIED